MTALLVALVITADASPPLAEAEAAADEADATWPAWRTSTRSSARSLPDKLPNGTEVDAPCPVPPILPFELTG